VSILHYVTISALLTDLYQLTMASGYLKSGAQHREAVFHISFRRNPFGSGYAIAGGLAAAIDYLRNFHFTGDELAYLRSLKAADGSALFARDFLDYLRALRLTVDVDAIPEGSVVFAHEPLLRVRGPLIHAQLVETTLLNLLNFSTLIATKAARIVTAAQGSSVLELGLRRAQGPDGGLSASRAAYLGGCSGTSNVLAGQTFGIPVAGTHAHSWVMAFEDEQLAFDAYADAMPNNTLLLVDTYDTLEGVRRAIDTGRRLATRGAKLLGIRLDSGDLAWLSAQARQMLDDAGLKDARIVASNDLDEELIASLIQQGAKIDTFGVGTRLVTAYDQPALGGVYKLGAIRDAGGEWQHRIKVSEQAVKTSIPGVLNVRRFSCDGVIRGDLLWDELTGAPAGSTIVDPADPTRSRMFENCEGRDLLAPILRGGELVYATPPLAQSREHARREVESLDPAIRRLKNPHEYPVGLEPRLHARRMEMIRAARRNA
jgi:nicotinate phosphoribosyltransferase